jgi:hypothetical protein
MDPTIMPMLDKRAFNSSPGAAPSARMNASEDFPTSALDLLLRPKTGAFRTLTR